MAEKYKVWVHIEEYEDGDGQDACEPDEIGEFDTLEKAQEFAAGLDDKCPECGYKTGKEGCSWEELNIYQFAVFPDVLLVMTNASPEAFTEATETFDCDRSNEGRDVRNIETVLHDMGYVAMTCQKPDQMLEFFL